VGDAGDPRITRLGQVLRRTHLDELPQVINVIRGEMSLVGPRPEQPGYVASLERQIPFYSRRHLARPGLTGWAQIACGYAGSESGAAWKLAHDLYYLKYRSLAMDLFIIVETLRTFLSDRQFAAHSSVSTLVYARPPVARPTHVGVAITLSACDGDAARDDERRNAVSALGPDE